MTQRAMSGKESKIKVNNMKKENGRVVMEASMNIGVQNKSAEDRISELEQKVNDLAIQISSLCSSHQAAIAQIQAAIIGSEIETLQVAKPSS